MHHFFFWEERSAFLMWFPSWRRKKFCTHFFDMTSFSPFWGEKIRQKRTAKWFRQMYMRAYSSTYVWKYTRFAAARQRSFIHRSSSWLYALWAPFKTLEDFFHCGDQFFFIFQLKGFPFWILKKNMFLTSSEKVVN